MEMRVIAGEARGLQLKAVPGKTTRPTTDKVKEAMFNIIGPYFDGGKALDLYAGSGALGIEALSRGMESCIFVDQNKQAIATIHANLSHTGYTDKAEVYRNDSLRALKAVGKRDVAFELILLDPPYAKQQIATIFGLIDDYHLLAPAGVTVCETALHIQLPDTAGPLIKEREECYGDTKLTVYKKG
jgi:16S rRNA (guanine966-N2)-methyltransferase